MGKEATQGRVRRRERKNIASGVAHVNASFNNTMITITDAQGNTIAWSSSGTMGFKGSRKSTPYAAQVAAEDAAKKASEHGMRNAGLCEVHTKQVLLGRLNPLTDGLRHFLRFAGSIPDDCGRRISDHNQRGERKILSALYDLGDTVDGDHLVFQLVRPRVEFLDHCWHNFLAPSYKL